MSFATRPTDPDLQAEENGRIRMELMRLRSARTKSADDERKEPAFKWDRKRYENSACEFGLHWAPLDPKRRVATQWKKLSSIDQVGFCPVFDGNEPDNFEVIEGIDGVLKVRFLRGVKIGAVENLSVLDYYSCRCASLGSPGCPNAEPVPDDEKLCPPLPIANFPRSTLQARDIAAQILKKDDPDELTFDEIFAVFKTRKPRDWKAILSQS